MAADDQWGERAQLALDTLEMKPTRGVPAWIVHTMDIEYMERRTGHARGDYVKDPAGVYIEFQHLAGSCLNDQFIPENPLTMGSHGFGSETKRSATTGLDQIVLDGMVIDSPEAVVEHLERFVFPRRKAEIESFPAAEAALVAKLIAGEREVQKLLGRDILKCPYGGGFQTFPYLHYGMYGYANYFMAYALYPDVIARDFAQQADLAVLKNRASARAIVEGNLPRFLRLDHDMADSRGTLVDIRTLDAIWFPQFARSIRPLLDAGVRLIWHCDGNLMAMVPRLLECGLSGFQGFQYEDGMDYERICRMKDRDGNPLLIVAGVSVTRTLPFGRPEDVRREMKWLVRNGPPVGLSLGASSTIAPGVPHENLQAFIEGLHYYRTVGREEGRIGGQEEGRTGGQEDGHARPSSPASPPPFLPSSPPLASEGDSEVIRDHIANPRNHGVLAGASGVGTGRGAQCADKITVYIRIRDDIITEIAFQSTGCPAAVACGSMVTELARGKSLDEAADISGEAIADALGGLPPDQRHLAQTAAEALENAIWDHVIRSVEGTIAGGNVADDDPGPRRQD
ncbi:MAG: iron-sulfur cluster assembly scaffold protein [Phycisphaerae bacterium]